MIILSKKYIDINDFISDGYATTFIIGARGVGKTISSFVDEIKYCYENDKKFIYLRRYQTEIDTLGLNLRLLSKLTGLTVMIDDVKDDTGRRTKMITAGLPTGVKDEDGNEKIKNVKNLGYLLALSVAAKYKSNDYTGTHIIIYDEFIDIRGRELKNETNLFLNFAMTVFRDFTKYKAVFLANATNIFNCYFVDFNILPRGKITRDRKLSIKIVMYQTSQELSARNATPLAKMMTFISNGGDSSLTNEFVFETGFLGKQSAKASCNLILRYAGKDYGLWKDYDGYVLSTKFDPSCDSKISLDEVNDEYEYRPTYVIVLGSMLVSKNLVFSDPMTRGVWFKLLKEKREI